MMTRGKVLILVLILSICSISYELTLARTFSEMSDREVLWHSLTIAIYVAALGLGALMADALLKSRQSVNEILGALVSVELGLVMLGSTSVALVWLTHAQIRTEWSATLFPFLTSINVAVVDPSLYFGLIICAGIGVLSGFEIPLLARVLDMTIPDARDNTSTVIAVNYIGTLIGTLLFIFLVSPHLSLGFSTWSTAVVNLLSLAALGSQLQFHTKHYALAACALFLLALFGVHMDEWEQRSLKATYQVSILPMIQGNQKAPSIRELEDKPPVLLKQSPYQTIHLVRNSWAQSPPPKNDPGLLPGDPFTLYIDRHFQMNSQHEALYHEFFIHYPIALLGKKPREILLLGAGDGLAAREILRYADVDSVTQVELDPMMIALARTHPAFVELNKGSMRDPRVHLEENDAFTYLKRNNKKFDAIFVDFPYPFSFDLSRLYSVEFYTFLRRSVSDSGFVVLDLPLVAKSDVNQKSRMLNDIFATTLRQAGFAFSTPYGGEGATSFDRETFLLSFPALPSGPPPPFQPPEVELRYLFNNQIRHFRHEDFEIRHNLALVHSIFKPTLLKLRDLLM